jgi:hypothetical protein
MMVQIAIMMSSVGALIKRPVMLVVGLGIGNVGLVYVVMRCGTWPRVRGPEVVVSSQEPPPSDSGTP